MVSKAILEPVQSSRCEQRVPNFMIVGEQKAGTSYLYANLRHHPDVFMTAPKEPLFFCRAWFDPSTLSSYLEQHFGTAGGQTWVGEASASYFHAEAAASRIKKAFPGQMKLIVCLRHPTEKAVSLYLHNYRRARLRGTERLMELEQTSFKVQRFLTHSRECARFLELFGAENVHFLHFHELRASPNRFVGSALAFLGLTSRREPLPRVINKGNNLKWEDEGLTIADDLVDGPDQVRPYFRREELQALHESVQDDVQRTEEVTGLDLSRWKHFPTFCSLVLSSLHFLAAFFDEWGDLLI